MREKSGVGKGSAASHKDVPEGSFRASAPSSGNEGLVSAGKCAQEESPVLPDSWGAPQPGPAQTLGWRTSFRGDLRPGSLGYGTSPWGWEGRQGRQEGFLGLRCPFRFLLPIQVSPCSLHRRFFCTAWHTSLGTPAWAHLPGQLPETFTKSLPSLSCSTLL